MAESEDMLMPSESPSKIGKKKSGKVNCNPKIFEAMHIHLHHYVDFCML